MDEVLARIGPDDRVLDVGGWACPFNRADWVLDSEPYETRGYYATIGLPASQGGDREHFTRETWIRRDICDHDPWPFPDKFFDFSICSHTLEDVRDPLFVCSRADPRLEARATSRPPRAWPRPAGAGRATGRPGSTTTAG